MKQCLLPASSDIVERKGKPTHPHTRHPFLKKIKNKALYPGWSKHVRTKIGCPIGVMVWLRFGELLQKTKCSSAATKKIQVTTGLSMEHAPPPLPPARQPPYSKEAGAKLVSLVVAGGGGTGPLAEHRREPGGDALNAWERPRRRRRSPTPRRPTRGAHWPMRWSRTASSSPDREYASSSWAAGKPGRQALSAVAPPWTNPQGPGIGDHANPGAAVSFFTAHRLLAFRLISHTSSIRPHGLALAGGS